MPGAGLTSSSRLDSGKRRQAASKSTTFTTTTRAPVTSEISDRRGQKRVRPGRMFGGEQVLTVMANNMANRIDDRIETAQHGACPRPGPSVPVSDQQARSI